MKISDEARRDVVVLLRAEKQAELCRLSDGELLDNLAETLGVDSTSEHYEDALVDRLIDLIDRPTTTLIEDEDGRTCCANCGCAALYMSDAAYCPDCGAEVFE